MDSIPEISVTPRQGQRPCRHSKHTITPERGEMPDQSCFYLLLLLNRVPVKLGTGTVTAAGITGQPPEHLYIHAHIFPTIH